MACTRKEILKGIREAIEQDTLHALDDNDGFIYHIQAGKIDALEILSIFTTARQNLLSELMEKLVVDGVNKEDVMDVIASLMIGFNQE